MRLEQTEIRRPIVQHNTRSADVFEEESIEQRFKAELRKTESAHTRLQGIVLEAAEQGITRKEMIEWGIEAGYSRKWIASVLSAILIEAGRRVRSYGGRKTPAEAVSVAKRTMDEYGERAVPILQAALRWARKHQKPHHKPQVQLPASRMKIAA